MTKNKKYGFTLAESLITLAVIGIVAMLIVPTLLKDVHAKSRIDLLQSTIHTIETAVQQEMIDKRTNTLEGTDLVDDDNISVFLQKFDIMNNPSIKPVNNIMDGYRNIAGNPAFSPEYYEDGNMVMLKNGVGIAIDYDEADGVFLAIDTNGANPPNTVGVDLFEWNIAISDALTSGDTDAGIHAGNVTINYTEVFNYDCRTALDECKNGDPLACSRALQLTGFNPMYLEDNNACNGN